ncbi:MAG TPA: type II toxin-antitoxin system CcdA family antitoxin [Rhizomicrobium sp.]|jgi:post-segregation antitoxin (ccd killing protein)
MSSRQMQRLLAASLAATNQVAPTKGRKRPTNVTIDEYVLNEARKHGINLSNILEESLRQLLHNIRVKEWQSTHKKAVDSYNQLLTPETK